MGYGGILASVDRANTAVAHELFGLDPQLFTVVPNVVREPIRADTYGFRKPGEFVVGHVGILNEGKGWTLTGAAVEQLRARGLPVRFVVAGGGPDQAVARAWCEARPEFAQFLGAVPDAADRVTPGLDLFALPSAGEGMPMALLEAKAAGAPALATGVEVSPTCRSTGRTVLSWTGCRCPRGSYRVTRARRGAARAPGRGGSPSLCRELPRAVMAQRYAHLYSRALDGATAPGGGGKP